MGTSVRATADGLVITAGWNSGYGRCVVIDHGNGYQTLYGHLSGLDVVEGQAIRQGEIVGRVGSTGRSTSPHLHYEVRIHATPVNPYRFLNRTPATQAASGPVEFPF